MSIRRWPLQSNAPEEHELIESYQLGQDQYSLLVPFHLAPYSTGVKDFVFHEIYFTRVKLIEATDRKSVV